MIRVFTNMPILETPSTFLSTRNLMSMGQPKFLISSHLGLTQTHLLTNGHTKCREVLHYTRHEITEQFIFFQPQLLRKLDLRTMYQHNSSYFQYLDRVNNLPIADVSQPATSHVQLNTLPNRPICLNKLEFFSNIAVGRDGP